MWGLVFSKYKLTPEELREIQLLLDDYTYTCGSKLARSIFLKSIVMYKSRPLLL